MRRQVAAISVGIVAGEMVLDLPYAEDKNAAVDMNVVMTGTGELIELQGTAEEEPFARAQLTELCDLAWHGIAQLCAAQREILQQHGVLLGSQGR